MTTAEAFRAFKHAEEIIAGCEDDLDALDALDHASDIYADCPADFTIEQRQHAQAIILDAHLKSIGRA